MTDRIHDRASVIGALAAREITLQEAATLLELSTRQVERLRASFNRTGIQGVRHGNTERVPVNALKDDIREAIVSFATGKYAGFNHSYLTEMLNDVEGIAVSRSTVRTVLQTAGIISSFTARRREATRRLRPRRPSEGALLQIDGSTHAWCGSRAGKATIISAVDDATNRLWCIARESEDLEGYMRLLRDIILDFGIPRSLYTDRSALAAGNSHRFKMVDKTALGHSQLQRAMRELGSTIILANSPQAKGRIERINATLQDRLVSFLALKRAASIRDINHHLPEYLTHHNSHFTVPPADMSAAWLPWTLPVGIDDVLCLKEERKVGRDLTVKVYSQYVALRTDAHLSIGQSVALHRRFDGSMGLFSDWQLIGGSPATLDPREGRLVRDKPTESLNT